MPSMKSAKSRANVDEQYLDSILVYVESGFDEKILKEYFFPEEGETFTFVSADEGTKGGGGCVKVRQMVHGKRQDNVLAFGLLDRDAFFHVDEDETDRDADRHKAMLEFLEPDPGLFQIAVTQRFGPFVRLLERWELENYLLIDADSIRRLYMNLGKAKVRSDELLHNCQEIVDLLIPDAAAKVLSHLKRQRKFARALDRALTSPDEIRSAYYEHVGAAPEGPAELMWWEGRVLAFAEGHPEPTMARWAAVTRILDGKCILMRLRFKLTHENVNVDNLKYQLATHIHESGRKRVILGEIVSILEELRSAKAA